MTHFDPETIARPALLLTNSGQASSFEEAMDTLNSEEISILVGDECCFSSPHQLALLTAANIARRAVGHVYIIASSQVLESLVLEGPFKDMTVLAAMVQLRAEISEQQNNRQNLISIGSKESATALKVTWTGWIASVRTQTSLRLAEDDEMPLAPIAAAGLAVSEIFQRLRGDFEAGQRDVNLSLWATPLEASFDAATPRVTWLPGECTLIGLGHLGQAYAWCLSHLPYEEPTRAKFQLQDFDHVTEATISTGLLTFEDDIKRKKTRVVAKALDKTGFSTTIIERRLLDRDYVHEGEPQLALIGVDNVETRRYLSQMGWGMWVDTGLGRGHSNYTRIRTQMFPGPQLSSEVPAWRLPVQIARNHLSNNAYTSLRNEGVEECGLVTIAGISIAVTFVGAVAACLSIASVLRVLHGGTRIDLHSFNLSNPNQSRGTLAEYTGWLPPTLPRRKRGVPPEY